MNAPVLLHVEFAFDGPWGPQLASACQELAADIAAEPGLRWKLWGEDAPGRRASGEYLFDTRAQAERYLEKHVPRLRAFGVEEVHARFFDINPALSVATRGLGGQ